MQPQAIQHNLAHAMGVGDLCFRRKKSLAVPVIKP